MFSRRVFLKTVKYSLASSALIAGGSGIILSHRIALEDFKDENMTAQYYKTRPTSSLLSSLFVYTISSSPILVSLGKASIQACDTIRLPIIYESIARRTFFPQFCGGENCCQVQDTMQRLRNDKLGVILAYAREESVTDESGFERVKQDTLNTIDVAAGLPNNFVALKLTALAKPSSIVAHSSFLRSGEKQDVQVSLSDDDLKQISNLEQRVECILDSCLEKGVKVLIDAEQDRYQATIEELTMRFSERFNKKEAIVYGTYQCYLKNTLSRISKDLTEAQARKFHLGVKLVRGAYIASDPRHLIHDTKEDSDSAYNDAIKLLFPQSNVETFIATHNSDSVELALTLMPGKGPVAFAQLYGMSSAMTYSLLQRLKEATETEAMTQGGGLRVYSYVPWGTVSESMKYLLRRADENSSMIARGKAERDEIANELFRRAKGRLAFL